MQYVQLFEKNGLSEIVSERGMLSDLYNDVRQAQSEFGQKSDYELGKGPTNAKEVNQTNSYEKTEFEKGSFPQKSIDQSESDFDDG